MKKLAGPSNRQTEQPTICLGFETAVLYWRTVREGRLPFPSPTHWETIPATCASSFRTLSQVDLSPLGVCLQRDGLMARYHAVRAPSSDDQGAWQSDRIVPHGIALGPGVSLPLHVLVSKAGQRAPGKAIQPHLVSQQLPPDSLYAISSQVLVSSPELTLAHLMRSVRNLPVLELVCEWCGSYALGPLAMECLFDRMPITDLARLESFVADPHMPRGSTALYKMLPLASERLASPRETEVFLMLTLPTELGGFALPAPSINQQIPLNATPFARLSDHGYFTVDFLWVLFKLVVEYDGLEDHEKTAQQIAADKERRSVLAAMGYLVIVVTKRDLASLSSFERKAEQIALALGVELPLVDQRVLKARAALFSWLFDPAHDHVPFGFGYA